jgi:hypothetical protein
MNKKIKILGLYIFDRLKEAGLAQKVLTKYSHIIKTRLGFHEVSDDVCSRNAIIILELTGNEEEWVLLEEELFNIGGINIQEMTFNK